MVTVGIGFLLAAAGFVVVGINMRPPGARIRYGVSWGLFENSTPVGRALGGIGIGLIAVAGLCIARGLRGDL